MKKTARLRYRIIGALSKHHVLSCHLAAWLALEVADKKGITGLFRHKTSILLPHPSHSALPIYHHGITAPIAVWKHIGYRKDTQVIWQYLNACYRFAVTNDWQSITLPVKLHSANEYSKQGAPLSIEAIYFHCLMGGGRNPYACRCGYFSHSKVSTQLMQEPLSVKIWLKNLYLYIDLI